MNILISLLVLVSFCFLASCANLQHEYPSDWEPLEVARSGEGCPDIRGTYEEVGESPNECPSWHEKCRSLSFTLLSGHIGYRDIWDESSEPRFSHGSHVEIRQENDTEIQVILWEVGDNEPRLVRRETLKQQGDDYVCTDGKVRLAPRAMYFLVGLSNMLGTETRELSVNEAGELVVHGEYAYIAHHVFIPAAISNEIWVRFQRDEQDGE